MDLLITWIYATLCATYCIVIILLMHNKLSKKSKELARIQKCLRIAKDELKMDKTYLYLVFYNEQNEKIIGSFIKYDTIYGVMQKKLPKSLFINFVHKNQFGGSLRGKYVEHVFKTLYEMGCISPSNNVINRTTRNFNECFKLKCK